MSGRITDLSLADVAGMIAARKLSSAEVTEACIERIAALGPTLRCVAGFDAQAARDAAAAADRATAQGQKHGALHGVPLAHKDMFYRKGRISASGSRVRADFVPDHTATVLERLDRAGALDVARLSMVEFALGLTGHNEVMGTPRNPWHTDHITGGSSSGPAGAVAAGLVYGALGSDTGGSIRVPAACCGLVGLKPSTGRVSRYGCLPLAFSLDHIGPLARTVTDCALLFSEIAGHDPRDVTTRTRPVPDVLAGIEDGVAGLRIAVPQSYFYDPVVPEVRRLLEDSLDVYRRLGATIVPVTIPGIERANPLTTMIIAVEGAALHARDVRARPDAFGRQTLSRLLPGLMVPAAAYLDALKLRESVLRSVAQSVFAVADLLHLPVLPAPVPTIAEADPATNPHPSDAVLAFGHCSRPVNYLGLPAISVPIGHTANGLPTGMQIVGRPFDEALLLRAARAYERETGATDRRPPC